MPEELRYVWEWYLEVRNTTPLTYTEIYHWSMVTGNRLRGWEAELIRSLDRIFWAVQYGRHG